MTTRLSTGLRNVAAAVQSHKDALVHCVMDIYSGSQPATADTAASGTLLASVTVGSGAFTAETKAVGALTIAGAAGSVDTVTVNSIDILGGSVAFTSDINATATAVAAQINANPKNQLYTASTTGASGVITITAVNGLGTLPNTWGVSGTYTTITGGTYVAMTGGVNALNGLKFGDAVVGAIAKTADTWSANAVANGTAGWFRLRGIGGDTGVGASSTAVRLDGAVATSGGQLNIGSLTVTSGAPFIVSSFSVTLPSE